MWNPTTAKQLFRLSTTEPPTSAESNCLQATIIVGLCKYTQD